MWLLVVKFNVLIILTICSSSKATSATCTRDQIKCPNEECISVLWRCDGERDCSDGSDESDCENTRCSVDQFRCDNGQCVLLSWVCDKVIDCIDSSDEKNCSRKPRTCSNHEFRCETDGSCLEISLRCNRKVECNDESDEKNCPQHLGKCKEGMFMCNNRACVYDYEVCDGHNDCSQNEDEMNCSSMVAHTVCQPEEFSCPESKRCISRKWICDGDDDCKDGSDEEGCVAGTKSLPTLHPVSEVAHAACQPEEYLCTGFKTCISRKLICDGKADCIDGSDEKSCDATTTRLQILPSDSDEDIKDSELIFYNEGCSVYIQKRKDGNEKIDLLPFRFKMGITGLSFRPKTLQLYIADEEPAIYSLNLSSLDVRILEKNNLSSPKDIKFDWMSNNLYWVDTNQGTIEVIAVDTLKRIVLIHDLLHPVALAISPYRGVMFVSEIGLESSVSTYGMDGKGRRILHSVQGLPMSLALHPSETLLYWSDPRQNIISYVNYSSESSSRIPMRQVMGVMSLAASEDRIFFTANETSLQADRKTLPYGKVHEIKFLVEWKGESWKSIAYSHGMKPSGKSECLIENGGCEYLCLTSTNDRTCACSPAMTLGEDGKSCLG